MRSKEAILSQLYTLVITSEPRKSAFEVAGNLDIGLLVPSDLEKLEKSISAYSTV